MDADRFDTLARSLTAAGAPRRSALRLLAGGAVAALTGGRGVAGVGAARCRPLAKRCRRGGRKCCVGKCQRRRCLCPEGTSGCGQQCCTAEQVCQLGATPTCVARQRTCQAGDETCVPSGTIVCDFDRDCYCHATLAGEPRCVAGGVSACGTCDDDADCATFGEGAICVRGGPFCVCSAQQGSCKRPCPAA